ncbi:ATP-dependent RNA helicase DbpA [Aliidiomarina soli]|uniref:ATP-dependent RNA helicase DbpA n=1 Tax=Aliidiomarina soli TaxID=1928574 RepID=A0A432WI62_9GAMM|nr:ATP-dependent RNA helicase DbpA [Aliidiomarina soli]RUO33411.1 ATP-dependent RNA helicase DbpA [Aliidiomarina soli]
MTDFSQTSSASTDSPSADAADISQLHLPAALADGLSDAGYTQLTAVQAASLPVILRGSDVIVQAATGTGKTVAFALGVLNNVDINLFSPQALVLCPTRELAEQVATEIRKLAKNVANLKLLTLCGGVPARAQATSLQHGAHVLVGTPGRVLDHLSQQQLDCSKINTLVLDEADRMLDMGFQDDILKIIEATPAARQTLLFSATYPKGMDKLIGRVTREPVKLTIATEQVAADIEQRFYSLATMPATLAVMHLLQAHQPDNCIVFCNTKREVQQLNDSLRANGYSALALHGDLEQRDRDQTMVQFSNGSTRILVATDVAARGLDISELDLVLCVHMAHDTDTHTHRIGRTGRAGAKGLAITLVGPEDDYKVRLLEDTLPEPIQMRAIPIEQGNSKPLQATMITLQINGGKKDKLRPGDIVGALTRDNALKMDDIGKIKLQANWGYIAVNRRIADRALQLINGDKIKGKRFRARVL